MCTCTSGTLIGRRTEQRDSSWGYSTQLAVDSNSQMIVYEDVVTDQSDTYRAFPIVEAVQAVKKEVWETKQIVRGRLAFQM